MAEKVLIVNICDRCGHEETGNKKTLPKGWMKIIKDDLCPSCTKAFGDWMNQPKNVAAEMDAPPQPQPALVP